MIETLKMSENDLLEAVIDLAHWHKWLVHHSRPALNQRGKWATHLQGDAGAPDLLLVRHGRIILAELKAEKGLYSDKQRQWAYAITDPAGDSGVEYYSWRPEQWHNGTILKVLSA